MTTHHPHVHRRVRYPELERRYELQETLGSGGFAKVKAAIHKLTGEKVAVKIMNKESLGADLPRVFREIKCLKKLHHQHICQLFEVIETCQMIYVVLEYCPGGELFDYIVAKERLREREARSFFRQILSALRYVHQCGFIHRDLKPENLLLDEQSNIKLIDFGLVAEPDDPQELLATCCGSPAYAAPELIRGGPYIGARADVWSLGVLLYALLNGFLPFDDDHTPYLYKLIQKGEYETPDWLTIESCHIISKLLQTNPERRISVDSLLKHKWVVTGYQSPVDWTSKIDLSELDAECVTELAQYSGYSEEAMQDELYKWKYDETTATYLLLLQQKLRGKQPRILLPPKTRALSHSSSLGSVTVSPLVRNLASKEPSSSSTDTEREGEGRREGEGEGQGEREREREVEGEGEGEGDEEFHTPPEEETEKESDEPSKASSPAPGSYQRRRISLGQPMHPPDGEILNLTKHLEKFLPPSTAASMGIGSSDDIYERSPTPYDTYERSPTPSFTFEEDETIFKGGAMSLPHDSSHMLTPIRPKRSVPFSPSTNFRVYASMKKPQTIKMPVKKTCSYDAQLNRLIHEKHLVNEPSTPQPSRKKRIGSIIPGHLLKTAKRVFTPRSLRRNAADNPAGPRRVKAVYDVTSTSMKTPEFVMEEMERVLSDMSIEYKKKNYVLHCKFNRMTAAQTDRKSKKVEFDLEVCFIPGVDMIGIRRKRIKGDTWHYKNICGQIFKATQL